MANHFNNIYSTTPPGYVSVEDFAEHIGMTDRGVRSAIQRGKITSYVKHGNKYLVHKDRAAAEIGRTPTPSNQRSLFPDLEADEEETDSTSPFFSESEGTKSEQGRASAKSAQGSSEPLVPEVPLDPLYVQRLEQSIEKTKEMKMRNEMLRGQLVDKNYVEKFSIGFFQRYREIITQLPAELSASCGLPEEEAKRIQAIANHLIDRAVSDMVFELEKKKTKLKTVTGSRKLQ